MRACPKVLILADGDFGASLLKVGDIGLAVAASMILLSASFAEAYRRGRGD
jgi:hypothetical protein